MIMCIMNRHEAMYTQYRPVCQTKMSAGANVHYARCITSQFAKLIVHQIYTAGLEQPLNKWSGIFTDLAI